MADGSPTEIPQESESASISVDLAQKDLKNILVGVPESTRPKLLELEELPLEEQAQVFRLMSRTNKEPEKFFMELYLARKLADPRFRQKDSYFIDPLISRLERGHRIVLMYEEPQGGALSRHMARFLNEVAEDEQLIIVDPKDSDVGILGIDWKTTGHPLRASNIGPEVHTSPGVQGLYEMYMRDWTHPAFKTGKDAKEIVKKQTTDNYEIKVTKGVVVQPPRDESDGVLRLDDGTEIEMANIRFCAIVGIDEKAFLKRQKNEIYLHRPVRVWYNERWHKGRINDISIRDLLEIKCEEKVTENERFLNGHGLSVKRNSFDLDLRDPALPEKKHPLTDHPQIREDNCIRYISKDGVLVWGYIKGINVKNRTFVVDTPKGLDRLGFDQDYDVVDTPQTKPENPLLAKGNTFKVYDANAGKYRVFEIKGIDRENELVIGEIESLRPSGMAGTQVLSLVGVELLGSPGTVLEKYPYLQGAYKDFEEVIVRFRHKGTILQGKVLTANTLPAFVEVIIEKVPRPKGHNADFYDRYDVLPEDLIGPVDVSRSNL